MDYAGKTGVAQEFIIPVNGIIDAHMHIMSGNCSPLPLAWGKIPDWLVLGAKHVPRSWISDVANSKPTKMVDKLIVFDQVSGINESAEKLGDYVKKLNSQYNFGVNAMGRFLLEISLKVIDIQRRWTVAELHLGFDTVYGVLDFVKEEIDAGADLASDVDRITQNVMSKIEGARRRTEQAEQNAVELAEQFGINEFFIKVGLKIIALAERIAQNLLRLILSATHTAADIAEKIDEIAAVYIKELKEFFEFIGEAAVHVTDVALEYGAKAILHFGASVLYGIVRNVADVKDALVNNAANAYEAALKKVDAMESATLNYIEFLQIQSKTTEEIGNFICKSVPFTKYKFSPLISMLMDMEYAHLDGYQGITIYRKSDKRYYVICMIPTTMGQVPSKVYLEPDYQPGQDKLTGVKSEPYDRYFRYDRDKYGKKGPAKWMYAEENDLFHNWEIQINQTAACAMKNPWQLFPMYHYDPRRWMKNWKEPFTFLLYDKAQTLEKKAKRMFLGFKMYPSLGYHPLDEHCPDLKKFYPECAQQKIPIMTHCSPGGMFTHEREHYLNYYKTKGPEAKKKCDSYTSKMENVAPAIQFFTENINSPFCWKQVLDLPGCSELSLCLAHFGGGGDTDEDKLYSGWSGKNRETPNKEKHTYSWRSAIVEMITSGKYPNLYTDFSCFSIKEISSLFLSTLQEELKRDRKKGMHLIRHILFGTDWYMTELFGADYNQFYNDSLDQIKSIDSTLRQQGLLLKTDPALWQYFSMINPFEFYNFYEMRQEIKRTMKTWNIPDDTIAEGVKAVESLNMRIKYLVKDC